MKKIVLDTNILVSGYLFGGKPRLIIEICRLRRNFLMAYSEAILKEFSKVIERPKFGLSEITKVKILTDLKEIGHFVTPENTINIIKKDRSDNRILECALAAEADFIISGDEHLLELGEFENIPIITAAKLLEKLNK